MPERVEEPVPLRLINGQERQLMPLSAAQLRRLKRRYGVVRSEQLVKKWTSDDFDEIDVFLGVFFEAMVDKDGIDSEQALEELLPADMIYLTSVLNRLWTATMPAANPTAPAPNGTPPTAPETVQ